jgi:ABC-2 type transport system ATP-binding protein
MNLPMGNRVDGTASPLLETLPMPDIQSPASTAAPGSPPPMIAVRGLTKRYDDFEALKGLDFSVQRGEIVGFLGPNGAGKTTTMKILTCYMPQSDGQVTVDGLDVATDSLKVRARIGYLPESTPLYTDMLVHDYLAHVATVRGVERARIPERIRAVADMCGIRDRLGQEIGTLSKGYKQRVGLAQALVHDPDILILDEPTSGLDPNQIVEIRNLIRRLGQNRTIILSTHNLPEVMATCNRILIIHRGRIVADGTAQSLEEREAETQRIRLAFAPSDNDSPEAIREALQRLEGVAAVRRIEAPPAELRFELEGGRGHDLRQPIYQLAVTRGWQLLELHREHLDLEGLFRKLTRDV